MVKFTEITFDIENIETNQIEESLGIEGFNRFFIEWVSGRSFLKIYLYENEDIPHPLKNLKILSQKQVEPDDWLRKFLDTLKPFEMIPGVVVIPNVQQYTDYKAANDRILIKLTPGAAFGTGLHPTTKMSAELVKEALLPGDSVADVGCGSGILAVLAKKLGASRVVAIDIDPVAVLKAKETAEDNGVKIEVIENDLLHNVKERFDLIVANIYAEVLFKLLDQVDSNLKNNGRVVLSGIVKEKLIPVKAKAAEKGLKIVKELEEEDWCALLLKK